MNPVHLISFFQSQSVSFTVPHHLQKKMQSFSYVPVSKHTHTHTHTHTNTHTQTHVRGAHIIFCNLDELMTSLLCFLHYVIDQFCITSDKNFLLDSIQPCSSNATKCPVRVTGLLPAVLTFRKVIWAMIHYDYCQGKYFLGCFQSLNTVLEINLCLKPLFSVGSDNLCLEREYWKTVTVVVEWQRLLPQKTSLG